VYLETPAKGARPNALGVKELLERLPHDNLPRPKTTTHPYELGAKDYGNNVGYSPNPNEEGFRSRKKEFVPSQEIPPEYIPKLETQRFKHTHAREYLVNDKQDTQLAYDTEQQKSLVQDQYDQGPVVYANYE
jgi:hypothetical protein